MDCKLLHRLFENRVNEIPLAPALVFSDRVISYGELNSMANKLANYIISLDIDSETLIGVCMTRSFDLIIVLLAILKSGKAYVPLDPGYPKDRLRMILADTKIKVIFSENESLPNLPDNQLTILKCDWEKLKFEKTHNPNLSISESNLAYIIYTSGTTGKPKGVMIEHQSVVSKLNALQKLFLLNINDVVLHYTSLSFDVSIEEIFWPLSIGSKIIISPPTITSNLNAFIDFIFGYKVTTLQTVPIFLDTLLEHSFPYKLASLKRIFVGGEALPIRLIKKYFDKLSCPLFNMYGPTEATIDSLYFQCRPNYDIENFQFVPIGIPLPGVIVHILDDNQNSSLPGEVGELYLAGESLARGYLQGRDITQLKFLEMSLNGITQRLYRTGDRVRLLSDGNIEYIGRSDQQIKLRGYRIELTEIEANLQKHRFVKQAIVLLQEGENEHKSLAAYIILTKTAKHLDEAFIILEIRQTIRNFLPEYMLPQFFTIIESFPINTNGKIDIKKLASSVNNQTIRNYVAPTSNVEKYLSKLWQEILKQEYIGIQDDFFELGGHSLKVSIMLMQVCRHFNVDIQIPNFLRNPTIENLTQIIKGKSLDPFFQNELKKKMEEDISLDKDIQSIGNLYNKKSCHPRVVLLTGATGLLGIYLLKDLCRAKTEIVYCLIRSKDLQEATRKLCLSIKQYFPSMTDISFGSKTQVIPLLGDLAKPKLGLSSEDYYRIANEVDTIYHNAANVHNIYNYHKLRAINVLSTIELIKLCTLFKGKQINYISTLDISSDGKVYEKFVDSLPPMVVNGYIQTKWVSEFLLSKANDRGIKVNIFRSPTIFGDSKSGAFYKSNDYLMNLLKSCIEFGHAPFRQERLYVLSVDFLSKAIVSISNSSQDKSRVFNLAAENNNKLYWETLISWLNDYGYNIELIPEDVWVSEFLMNIEYDNTMFPFISLYLGDETIVSDQLITFVETLNSNFYLSKLGIPTPEVNYSLFKKYIDFFAKTKFIQPPFTSTVLTGS